MPKYKTISPEKVKKAAKEEGVYLIEDAKFGREGYVSVQSSWPNLMRFVRRILGTHNEEFIVVEEHYLKKCLDSGVYQSILTVQIGSEKIQYKHDVRLWKEEFIESLRANERRMAREYIMRRIRVRLFGTEE